MSVQKHTVRLNARTVRTIYGARETATESLELLERNRPKPFDLGRLYSPATFHICGPRAGDVPVRSRTMRSFFIADEIDEPFLTVAPPCRPLSLRPDINASSWRSLLASRLDSDLARYVAGPNLPAIPAAPDDRALSRPFCRGAILTGSGRRLALRIAGVMELCLSEPGEDKEAAPFRKNRSQLLPGHFAQAERNHYLQYGEKAWESCESFFATQRRRAA